MTSFFPRTMSVLTFLFALTLPSAAQTTDLIFSEYVEGSSNNKALEIYNGTGSAANLAEYVVELYNNGAVTPNSTLTLSDAMATLADGQTLVIVNASAAAELLALGDITSSVTFFNGDDALVLKRNGVVIDTIGIVGSDPGSQWGSGDASTQDNTIRRLDTVCSGDVDGFDNPADISAQWAGFPSNTFSGLGTHTTACAGADDLLFTEYVEGSGNNKAIEIYNGTGAAANLAEYVVELYNNGAVTPNNSLTLSDAAATLADGQTLVIVNASAAAELLALGDITSAVTFFNGDDALVLKRNGVVIDTIGIVGSDPGSQWGTGDASTQDNTIRRLVNICTGDVDGFDNPADITDQWAGFPSNTFDGLGLHDLSCGGVVEPPPEPIAGFIINEFLADPAADLSGDANGDGVRDASQDEFVEIVNTTGAAQDLSGWTLVDGVGVRHSFPAGTLLDNQAAIVVFGGGQPTGTFGDAQVQTASTGTLGLNNGGDTIRLVADNGVTQVEVTYGSEGSADQSLTLDPDLTGLAFVAHAGATGSGGALFSPGTQIDGTPFGANTTQDLFFSEYVEGSGNNKALEIFNGTGSAADLTQYVVEIYNNGAVTPNNSLQLSDAQPTLADGEVLVIVNSSAAAALLNEGDITSAVTFFNGDDALVLKRDGNIIDVIGVVGSDPGSQWGSGDASTQDSTIRRLASVCEGDVDGFDNPADISDQWEGFPINTFAGIGSHSVTCAPGGGNQPVVLDCGGDLTVDEGVGGSRLITASDADGTITSITLVSVSPAPASGSITLGSLIPGSPAGASLDVSAAVPAGAYTLTIQAENTDVPAQTADCTITVNVTGVVSIAQIQGTGTVSPFVNQFASTRGNIVTGVAGNGFYMQTPDALVDANPDTSEGIFVFTNATPAVVVGDEVDVSGNVVEFFDFTEFSDNVTFTVVSSGNPLPAAVLLDDQTPSPIPGVIPSLEPLEGMLVEVIGAQATGPTDRFGDTPITSGNMRTFREPGIAFPGLPGLPVWDGNPEVFEINVDGVGLANQDIFAGSAIQALGPLGFSFGDYQLNPLQINVTAPAVGLPRAVRAKVAGEFTIATQNFLRLFRDQPDAAGYQDRLNKFSQLIRDVLGAPDILAISEVENIAVLQDLTARILSDDPSVAYSAYLLEGNDVGGIDVGFLVRASVTVTNVVQIQASETFTFNGVTNLLHDRPPLLLEGVWNGGSQPFPISVMAIHNRSLNNIDDPSDGPRVREKRFQQADRIAQAIQDLQVADPSINLVVTGDFNAFEFTDGYVDAMGILTGDLDPLGALVPGIDRIDPNLENQVLNVPLEERYSFIFGGNAQVLDHLLTSQAISPLVTEVAFGRANADAPNGLGSDGTTPLRASDHDGIVAFFQPFQGPVITSAIIDNTDPEFSSTGSWPTSTAVAGFQGDNYQYNQAGTGNDSATWTLSFPETGEYRLFARWTNHPNRASNAVYTIQHDGGVREVSVNQKKNGGQFQPLGTFRFSSASTYAVILDDDANGFVIADAIRWERWTPPAEPAGQRTIDNLSADFETQGVWPFSTVVSGFFADNYQFNASGTGSEQAIWRFSVADSGLHEVYARWTQHPNRATNAAFTIDSADGTDVVVVDQQSGGGIFRLLGAYHFSAGVDYAVSLSDDANGFVIADAVRTIRVSTSSNEVVVDNEAAAFSTIGSWTASTVVPGFLGSNYVYRAAGQGEASATWTAVIDQPGTYTVYARWTSHPNRATNAVYTVEDAAGTTAVSVNQRQDGGSWVPLGTFTFNSGSYTVHLDNQADRFVIADAVRWQRN